jgi:hypothetical protein
MGFDDSDDVECKEILTCDNDMRSLTVGTLDHVTVSYQTLDAWGNPIDAHGRPLPVPAEPISCDYTASGNMCAFDVSTVVIEELS